MRRRTILAGMIAVLALGGPAAAELSLPAGFTMQVYVTGQGFDPTSARGARGIPSVATLAFDSAGTLYLARTGRRYSGNTAEVDDRWPIFRIPLGGARLTPGTERSFFYGPPLPNGQVGAVRGTQEAFVTTFDRERRIGVLYRLRDGRAELFAGGTPERGVPPLLKQPEGAVVDSAGNFYVADRDRGAVVRLGPTGALLDARLVSVPRPRVLAIDERDRLWIGSDGTAEAPWQRGPGEIWTLTPGGTPQRLLKGPVPGGISVSPSGQLFVADRQGAQIFALSPDGKRVEFARFTDGDAPRALLFAPATPDTQRAGVAGSLFVVAITGGAFPVN
ncbi:MAG TPA: hypothetical protein VML54_17020, partial [Candidatus Limnocylindrales bacterium]|nr:hypothetical protein [Candidatus Limnocylindrales bacterium]